MFNINDYEILIDHISLFDTNKKEYDKFIRMLYNLIEKYNIKDGCAANSLTAENQRILILCFNRELNFNNVSELYTHFTKFVKELKKKDKNNLVVNISLYERNNVTSKFFKDL